MPTETSSSAPTVVPPAPATPPRRPGALRHVLALMDTIPEPEGADAAWEAVERGIREARAFPGRDS